jgi:hypothetical protein
MQLEPLRGKDRSDEPEAYMWFEWSLLAKFRKCSKIFDLFL